MTGRKSKSPVKKHLSKLAKPLKSRNFTHGKFSRANLTIFAVIFAAIGGYLIYSSFAATVTCNLNATTSNFKNQLSTATTGQAVCLASGSYGAWDGTDSTGSALTKTITITAAPGASPSIELDLGSNTKNFTVDGTAGGGTLTVTGLTATASTTARNLIIKNSAFTGVADFDGIFNGNILLDHNTHDWNAVYDGFYNAKIRFAYGGTGDSGITVQNSHIANGNLDGVHTGVAIHIRNNVFDNLCDTGTNHTDNIQFEGANGGDISGNYVHENATCDTQGITSFDGSTVGVTIQNNVVDIPRPWGIEFYADKNSIIRHNTVVYHPTGYAGWNAPMGSIDINYKTGSSYPAGSGTHVYDNIATDVSFSNGSTGTADHNVSGATAVYVGGANPTTHDGFLLASSSPVGKKAASDGTDAGVYALAPTCNINVTTASLTALNTAVNSATGGQTVCLAANGDYGNWAGTNKAITVTVASGITATMSFDFTTGSGNFTLDGGHTNNDPNTPGININGGSWIEGDAHDITIKNLSLKALNTNFVVNIMTTGTGIVVKNNVFHDQVYPDTTTGAISVNPQGSASNSNVLVENNLFINLGSDAVDLGGPGTIIGNEFNNVNGSNPSDPRHTDAIQIYGGHDDIIKGNWVHGGCTQGIGAFDGTSNNDIEDNVVDGCTIHSMVLGADSPGSILNHNTIIGPSGSAIIDCTSKPGSSASKTSITNNITQSEELVSGGSVTCTPPSNTNNMWPSGAASPNFNGTPTFVGGNTPTTFAGYALTSTSAGHNAATDGTDVGARVNLYSDVGGTGGTGSGGSSDATPPTVSMTAPSPGATVSGASVALSANAADNVGVAGVQFKVDGNNVGTEDTASPYSITWDSRTVTNGTHTITAVARDAAGNSTTSSSVTITTNNTSTCSTSTASFTNSSFAAQTGSFTFTYDATPSATGIDSVTGLSNGPAGAFTDLAAIVRFNTSGTIDARNGGAYAAVNAVNYTAGTAYHFVMTVNVANHTYSVTVTPSGGSATTIATNYAFRTEQASVSSLANWATNSTTGSQSTCSATLGSTGGTGKIGDLNDDGAVNIFDLSILLSKYNTADATADLNKDNIVNVFDLSILLSHYGT